MSVQNAIDVLLCSWGPHIMMSGVTLSFQQLATVTSVRPTRLSVASYDLPVSCNPYQTPSSSCNAIERVYKVSFVSDDFQSQFNLAVGCFSNCLITRSLHLH